MDGKLRGHGTSAEDFSSLPSTSTTHRDGEELDIRKPTVIPHKWARNCRWPKLLPFELAWGMKIGDPESQKLPDDAIPLAHIPSLGAHTIYLGHPQLDDPRIDVALLHYRHTCVDPRPLTTRPWRPELERCFRALESQDLKDGYIQCYTVGYFGERPPSGASLLFEQAYNFGLVERLWDIDMENGIYRDRHGISDEGKIDDVQQYLAAGEIPDHVEDLDRSEADEELTARA
ncbi:hypothetical protein TWF696_000202 [Orbilia brochopaga]|uniref:Uncharacterized protein n=1 Tax=Orbilia brochopaga TaxID=3140254 RepID=A0AAV9VDN1_9PEZI